MKLLSNPIILGYRISLWGKRGYAKNFSTARAYNLVTPTGRVLWKKAQPFPAVIKSAGQKREFLAQVINHIEQQRLRKNLRARLRRREQALERIKRAPKKEKPERVKELEEEKRELSETLFKSGIDFTTRAKKLFSQKAKRDIEAIIKTAMFDPIPFNASNMQKILSDKLAPAIEEALRDTWSKIKPDQKRFLLRILYRDRVVNKKTGKTEWRTQGVGLPRDKIQKEETIPLATQRLTKLALHLFVNQDKSYFASGFVSPSTQFVGFTIEHMGKEGPPLRSAKLQARIDRWNKERVKFDDQRAMTKAELARERRKRGYISTTD